jgi:D-sedoheptulose 7-phosphate isomerase
MRSASSGQLLSRTSVSGSDALSEHAALLARVEELLPRVDDVAQRLISCFGAGGRVYTFGNGGSSADAAHFAEELLGRFKRERRPLPAQSLSIDAAALTCIANDYSFDEVFERQVRGFVRAGDVVIGFSTSGRSANVVRGLAAAREVGAVTVLFGGGAPAADHADVVLQIPSESTARIQEMHVLLLHLILEQVDAWAAS